MFFARPRTPTRLEVWPTFVDALSTVLMAIVFVLMTFLVAQVFLVETINDRDTELARLQNQLRQFELSLTKAKNQHQTAATKVNTMEELIKNLNTQLAKLTQDITQEKQQHGDQRTLNERIKTDLEKLEERLKQLQTLLQQTQDESSKKDDTVKGLHLSLNQMEKEQEKHKNSIRVGQFRSQFFAQLKNILGDRSDVTVVDDRFIFQSEVLFAVGSAELGEDGKAQLNGLVKALKEIGAKIPPEINWILRVDGHTDNRPIKSPQFPSNWELSTARAIAVVQYMLDKGIDGKHLVAAGFGQFQPLNLETSDIDRNRRIEFKLDQR